MSDPRAQGLYAWDVGMDLDALVCASARHLADLRRAYPEGAPRALAIAETSVPKRFFAETEGLMTSPARACASVGEGA